MQSIDNISNHYLPDEQLADKVKNGCLQCFEQLVLRYHGNMLRFVNGKIRSREDAEEVVQDAFLKVYRNIDKFNAKYTFKTWLYTITRNCMISHLRKKNKGAAIIYSNETITGQSVQSSSVSLQDDGQAIWETARQLVPDQYMAVWLKYHEQMDIDSIAQAMGKTSVNVRVLLHRARNSLRRKLSA